MLTIEQQTNLAKRAIAECPSAYAGYDLAIKYTEDGGIAYAFFASDLDNDLWYKGYASEHVEEGESCWIGNYDTHEILFNNERELKAKRCVPSSIVILEVGNVEAV